MNHLLFSAFQIARDQSEKARTQTEAELFEARGDTLKARGLAALLPRGLAAWIAARRKARHLQAEIARLERLSPHLLDDIGVQRQGSADYVVMTDEETRLALPKQRIAGPVPSPVRVQALAAMPVPDRETPRTSQPESRPVLRLAPQAGF